MPYVIDQVNCSGCHRCRMECPVGAIRFKNAKYWIDPEKCVSCGTCQKVCHNGCIGNPDAPKTEVPQHEPISLACDVCVIGGGGAGMVAAAKASDMGAKVIVLEKNHEIGGSAWYATGFGCYYSDLHAEAGMADPREKKCAEFIRKTGGRVNPELVKRMFEANTDWFNWLLREHDFRQYYELNPKGFAPMNLKKKVSPPWNDRRIDAMIGPGGNGWFIPVKMLEILTANGGEIYYNAPAERILTDESGQVTGVVARDPGGELQISCKAVVVASGAFTRNKKIMDKMQPLFYDDKGKEPIHIFTCSTCTGDGITMCEEIGADIDYVNRRVNMFGPMRHPYPGVSLNAGQGPMFKTNGEPYEMSFSMTEVSNLAYDPDRYLWKITDDGNTEASINAKIAQGRDDNGVDISAFLKNWRQVLQEEAEDNAVVIADTIPELAEKLGYDPVKFAAAIEEYNRSLSRPKMPPFPGGPGDMPGGPGDMPGGPGDMPGGPGEMPGGMPDFGADGPDGEDGPGGGFPMMGPPAQPIVKAPFYAIKLKIFHENSVGGMATDENTSVLKDGKPIPGLYAAGDTARGIMLPGDIGVQYIEGTFTALTVAFNAGYISGVEAAGFALS